MDQANTNPSFDSLLIDFDRKNDLVDYKFGISGPWESSQRPTASEILAAVSALLSSDNISELPEGF